jgi:hypothetical protein
MTVKNGEYMRKLAMALATAVTYERQEASAAGLPVIKRIDCR